MESDKVESGLLSRERPWVHSACNIDEVDIIRQASQDNGNIRLVEMDGRGMETLEDLFKSYAKQFKFPSYFGNNWAAFHDIMRDLSETPSPKYVTVIDHAESILSDDPKEAEQFVWYANDIGRYWSSRIGLPKEFGWGEVAFNTLLVFREGLGACYSAFTAFSDKRT